MSSELYSLAEVLAVAKVHPFYVPEIQYPPKPETVKSIREEAKKGAAKATLGAQKLLCKKDLNHAIGRLLHDTNPQNTYTRGCYMTITGGGSGGPALFFAADAHENRRQRAQFGKFLNSLGIVQEEDWVLTTHVEGRFYRSMSLTAEIIENGGGSVLCAGDTMQAVDVIKTLAEYNINVLCGESSQIINIARHMSTLPPETKERINIEKVIYTSEMLTATQKAFIKKNFGPVKICSFLGSAEAGAWAASDPDLTGTLNDTTDSQDFVFDTRTMLIEIFSPSIMDSGYSEPLDSHILPVGQTGVVAQTHLQRLRNPLVRFIPGDIGSLHTLPQSARDKVPDVDFEFLRVLRLHGRDHRFSFAWDGSYFEFAQIAAILNSPEYGILHWQLILGHLESSPNSTVEIRLLCPSHNGNAPMVSREAVSKRINEFFHVDAMNASRIFITFLDDREGFVRSKTGDKIIKFVDQFNKSTSLNGQSGLK